MSSYWITVPWVVWSAEIDNTCIANPEITDTYISGAETICIVTINDYTMNTFPGADIEWDIPGGVIYTGGGGLVLTVTEWPGVGTYTFTCTASHNCFADTATYTINVIDPGSGVLIDEGFCEGENVTVDVTQTDATYLWFDSTSNATHVFEDEGIFWVEITSSGCSFTDTITITEFPLPEIDLGNDILICGITTVNSESGFDNYAWSNGAITESFETSIPGIYLLTVTDENGCTAEDEIELINDCPDIIVMPNVFSPNDDGINDLIGPLYSGVIDNYKLQIWNRWGELIFDTNKIDKFWDGTFEGEPQDVGSFVYRLTAKLNKEPVELFGNITLVR
ncbi:MAG: gliding motility-associated C-terminal domain-containing protein [Chitinophagales bacterium]